MLLTVAPSDCEILWDEEGCVAHQCGEEHCAPGLWLHEDPRGCPRCRNTPLPDLADAIRCLLDLPDGQCRFPQPLLALERHTHEDQHAHPPCLEVCPWGLCSTNRDPQVAYAQGHPEVLDAALPVFACWALAHQPKCEDSREVTLAMSYRELPGPRSWVALAYSTLADHESLCFDGIDNDGDCLVDEEDPDCQ